jgi:beta-galactosidase
MLYGAAYYPEHRDPDRWEYDLDHMVDAHVNALRVGEFAWKRFEPADGEYDFAWMDRFAELALTRGIGLVLCPPLRTVPAWLFEQDPSMAILDGDGVRLAYSGRYSFCINHPLFRRKGLALAERMAAHYAGSESILHWHLDNEFGCEEDCHCPLCRTKWHEFLRGRYESIDRLNARWGTVFWGQEYDRFEQVPTPARGFGGANPGLVQAWRRFRSDCTIEMVDLHAQAVRRHDGRPISTNNQPLWNFRTDYYALAEMLDACGTNLYPPYGEDCRALALGLASVRSYKPGNFCVYELRNGSHMRPGNGGDAWSPGQLEREVLHTVANGADGVFFFRWRACPFGHEWPHGTIADYDGTPKRIHAEAARIGERLRGVEDVLAGTEVVSDVALLYDFPTRWARESGNHWQGPASMYMDHAKMLYDVVRSLGVNVDAVGRHGDWSGYKLLLVPGLEAIDDETVEKLAAYVHGGGLLVWHPLSGMRDRDLHVYPSRLHPGLEKLFGLSVREFAPVGDTPQRLLWRGRTYDAHSFCDLPELGEAEPLALYQDGWFSGTPAIAERVVGDGLAVYFATFPVREFYDAWLGEALEEAGVHWILSGDVPHAVEVAERRSPDGRRVVFVINCTPRRQTILCEERFEDVWAGERTGDGEISLGPWQGRVMVDVAE